MKGAVQLRAALTGYSENTWPNAVQSQLANVKGMYGRDATKAMRPN